MGQSRPKGSPKTPGSGRQRGTPNKKTLALIAICDMLGISPFEKLLEFVRHPDPNIALNATKAACEYLYPKRKAIEVSVEEMSDEEIAEDLKRRLDGKSSP